MTKRNLYLNNVSVEEALEMYLKAFKPEAASENVNTADALGRLTARAVYAKRNSPLYDSAAMDGIAVISERTHGAGETSPRELKVGDDCIIVDTGDPIRPPYDAIIMAEDLEEAGEDAVRIRSAAAAWQHVRPVGEDIVQGEMLLPGGAKIRPADIGAMLSGGITRVDVRKKPFVAVIPTGTEIIEPEAEPKEGDIIESNSRMLAGLITQGGGSPDRYTPVHDVYEKIKGAISEACDNHDMTLVIAGSSAGTEDFTVHALRELGEVVVHGVAMKPGKPVILAVVNGKPVIGIPGYPVSAYIAYTNFGAPVLELLSGVRREKSPVVKAVLTRRLISSLKYKEYVRVKVGRVGEKLVASPLARGAGAAMSLVRADGFCVLGQNLEGAEAGTEVDVELVRPLSELDTTVVSIGSHDLILDVLADMMPDMFAGMSLSSAHVGSMGGLLALRGGEAHIAPVHLLDEATGEYNMSYIKKVLGGAETALIKGVGRTQGIIVPNGNPKGIMGIADLAGARYINRQRGAGTRVLFDYLLKREGISSESVNGYDREAATHMAVAAAVKSGSADAGMGILSAAKAMELDFIPIRDEEYDFAIPVSFLELPHIKAFVAVLQSAEFKQRLGDLGGYTCERAGEIIYG